MCLTTTWKQQGNSEDGRACKTVAGFLPEMNEKQRGRNPSNRKSLRKLLAQKLCVALIWIVIRNQLTNSFLKIYVFISMYWLHIIMGFLMAFSDILIIHFDHIHMLLPSLTLLPPRTGSPSSSQGVPFYSRVFAYMNQWVLLELLPKTRAEAWARGCLGTTDTFPLTTPLKKMSPSPGNNWSSISSLWSFPYFLK